MEKKIECYKLCLYIIIFKGHNDAFEDCNQNDVDGLGPVVADFWDNYFPLADVLTIILEYLSDDPEVQRAFEYLESEEFGVIVETISNKNEFIVVLEFFCEELKLNVYFYLNSLGGLLGFPQVTRPPLAPRFDRPPGVVGMLNEIRDVMPSEELAIWWEEQLQNQYVANAIVKIKSDYFRSVAEAVQALPEFDILIEKLEDIGIPANDWIISMYEWLGWA